MDILKNSLNINNVYLVTGCAGFIGFHLCNTLLNQGCQVIGLDNLNNYYAVDLKKYRLGHLTSNKIFTFIKADIDNQAVLMGIFEQYRPDIVVNLAAQAGVRYSIENPDTYIQSNLIGFYNILKACREFPVLHLIYASSSSVYGANTKIPFSVNDNVDQPLSLYAATKKTNELLAHTYSYLYKIPCTGLRFFTVYGPMGRPDMAYFSFTKKIMNEEPIQVYNYGDCYRDFTYIDDIIEAMVRLLCNPPAKLIDKTSILNGMQYTVYNIGNSHPEHLLEFITALEKALSNATHKEIRAKKELVPMQPGDVKTTYSDSSSLEKDFGFKPNTPIEIGLQKFVNWYLEYYECSNY